MTTETIDTAMARRLLEALAIQGASIIGYPRGWPVMLTLGTGQKHLCVHRSDKPRTWRSLDRWVDCLNNASPLSRFDLPDAALYRAQQRP